MGHGVDILGSIIKETNCFPPRDVCGPRRVEQQFFRYIELILVA